MTAGLKVKGEWKCVSTHSLSWTCRKEIKKHLRLDQKTRKANTLCVQDRVQLAKVRTRLHEHTNHSFLFFPIQEYRLVSVPWAYFQSETVAKPEIKLPLSSKSGWATQLISWTISGFLPIFYLDSHAKSKNTPENDLTTCQHEPYTAVLTSVSVEYFTDMKRTHTWQDRRATGFSQHLFSFLSLPLLLSLCPSSPVCVKYNQKETVNIEVNTVPMCECIMCLLNYSH